MTRTPATTPRGRAHARRGAHPRPVPLAELPDDRASSRVAQAIEPARRAALRAARRAAAASCAAAATPTGAGRHTLAPLRGCACTQPRECAGTRSRAGAPAQRGVCADAQMRNSEARS